MNGWMNLSLSPSPSPSPSPSHPTEQIARVYCKPVHGLSVGCWVPAGINCQSKRKVLENLSRYNTDAPMQQYNLRRQPQTYKWRLGRLQLMWFQPLQPEEQKEFH